MTKGIDGWLTKHVQKIWPDATVKWEGTGEKDPKAREIERWWVERPGEEDLVLGKFYAAARLSVNMLLKEHGIDDRA